MNTGSGRGARAIVPGLDAPTWELYEKIRSHGYLGGLERLAYRGDSVTGSIRMPPYIAPM